ncbi:MAG: hypothetical protein HY744_27290, partial [Deltaproteobacteria bacterium]|nr:hypothetical protein [Deltaproteobacteria bacterium]
MEKIERALGALAQPQLQVRIRQEAPPGLRELVAQQLALVEQALVPLARSVLDERAQPAAGRRARSRRNLAAEAEGGAAAPAAPVSPAPALEAKLGELAKGLEALQSRLDAAGPGPGVPRFDVELGLASESN